MGELRHLSGFGLFFTLAAAAECSVVTAAADYEDEDLLRLRPAVAIYAGTDNIRRSDTESFDLRGSEHS